MPNRQLNSKERELASQVLSEAREKINNLSGNDSALEWALRRYIYIRLQYDERGTPMERRLLKAKLMGKQNAKCALCDGDLPEKGAVLDRIEAMSGYTEENTRLLCPDCNTKVQEQRHYS